MPEGFRREKQIDKSFLNHALSECLCKLNLICSRFGRIYGCEQEVNKSLDCRHEWHVK